MLLPLWARWSGIPKRNLASSRIYRCLPSALPCRCSRLLSTTASARSEASSPTSHGRSLTEKIASKFAVGLPDGKLVRSGDYISISPHHCMTHDNSAPVMRKFQLMGATRIHTPEQIVTTLDHDIQNTSPSNLDKYQQLAAFASRQGIAHFKAGTGIGHQIMVEEGYAWPGTMVVASDSHAVHYGALGCLGTPIVRTDASAIWALSQTWWQVPPVARVAFRGTLPFGVTGKDVIAALCGIFKGDVLNHAVEFTGFEETLESLSMDCRMAIANMSCEWGALSAVFPVDQTLQRWLRRKAIEAATFDDRTTRQRINHQRIDELFSNPPRADRDAVYAKQLYLNLSSLSPCVSGPNTPNIATPLHEIAAQNIRIDRAYIVSCTASRASDIKAAAKVFRDAASANPRVEPKVADGVSLYMAAASAHEQKAAENAGDWQTLIDAGTGLLQPGEVGISASNRNFPGRMGSRDAQTYLASPEVVAASALRGTISGPDTFKGSAEWSGVEYGFDTGSEKTAQGKPGSVAQQLDTLPGRAKSAEGGAYGSTTDIIPGFPKKISGEIIFCDADHISTDALYPGKLTYQDNVSQEEMARACMQNYDPNFDTIAKPNDVVVGGYNFGCGSSREQAATALLAKQIPLVVSGSFGSIFARNCINNALMTLTLPRLVERLRVCFPAPSPSSGASGARNPPTRRTGWTLTWDIEHSVVEVQEGEQGENWVEKVGDLPANVQVIIAAGGLESWCRAELAKSGAT